MNNQLLNVVYSSDDNYAQHMGVSIYSLLDNNKGVQKVRIFVIDNDISDDNKNKVQSIIDMFLNAQIAWIPFGHWKEMLDLNMSWNISLSSYARLFLASMLPLDVHRVLYLDCDMVIRNTLCSLWNTNLEGNVIGAVQDSISPETKRAVGLSAQIAYFNAGMLLIDLDEWRNRKIEEQCMRFIDKYNGKVVHHDQGVLNGVFNGEFKILPLQYNLMTIHYVFNRKKIMKYFKEQADFYDEKDIHIAKAQPTILHFTPSFTSRPWIKGCNHPMKDEYWQVLQMTLWKDYVPQKDSIKWYAKLIEWWYRVVISKI